MKVMHVINSLGPGGAERSLVELLPLLREAGVASQILCLTRAPEGFHQPVLDSGQPVHVIGSARLAAVRRIRSQIRVWRPDVVHTTIFEADVLARVAAAGTGCRVLTSLVNTTYDGVRAADSSVSPRRLAAAKAVDGFTARHLTHHFHAITDAVKTSAVQHLRIPPERITVVERGRSLTRLGEPSTARRLAVRRSLGVPQEAEVVLNVGRQEPQKAQADLLEAMVSLAATRPRLVLLQAGREGKTSSTLRHLVDEHGLGSRVRFLGHRDDVGDLLASADVFAFPSIYEGLGGSLIEAMALQVPAVVTDVPALVEVVEGGRGALVVPVRDPSELANAIGRLLENRGEAREMAARARQIFLARFTLERSAEKMVELYRRVAAEGSVS